MWRHSTVVDRIGVSEQTAHLLFVMCSFAEDLKIFSFLRVLILFIHLFSLWTLTSGKANINVSCEDTLIHSIYQREWQIPLRQTSAKLVLLLACLNPQILADSGRSSQFEDARHGGIT